MDRARLVHCRIGWFLALAMATCTGCQTVKTPEEKIAKSTIPREFTKVSMPEYVVEPPDLILVEVLEALPGRPITGERLVRPDGKISLGFYGELYVSGLTIPQIKTKLVLHLREYLTDQALGLVRLDEKTEQYVDVDPDKSDRLFVDVTAYNSKVYYVQGDVAQPGRLPITGNETVLDAINYTGGLIPTASTVNIQLVRPAPPGASCEQRLPVNYAAIVNAGDSTTNYQLMPGDRLVVYRDPIVRTTVFLERLSAPFNVVLNSVLQYSFTARNVQSIGVPINGGFGNGGNTNTNRGNTPIVGTGAR